MKVLYSPANAEPLGYYWRNKRLHLPQRIFDLTRIATWKVHRVNCMEQVLSWDDNRSDWPPTLPLSNVETWKPNFISFLIRSSQYVYLQLDNPNPRPYCMKLTFIIIIPFAPRFIKLFSSLHVYNNSFQWKVQCKMQHLKSIFKEIMYDLYFNLHKIQNGGNMVQTKLTQILLYNVIYLSQIFYMYARKLVKRHSSFVEIPARRRSNIHGGYMFTAHWYINFTL
jgi:hypothetical protein